jgi:hypothetical protein
MIKRLNRRLAVKKSSAASAAAYLRAAIGGLLCCEIRRRISAVDRSAAPLQRGFGVVPGRDGS